MILLFFFFQAEDGIRDIGVTGVQTCALPILRTAMNAVKGEDVPVREFAKDLREQMRLLDMDPRFAERNLNEGFSGGEKKRHEILQMALLRPELAILDETRSEEHTSELQSRQYLVCRLLLEKKIHNLQTNTNT